MGKKEYMQANKDWLAEKAKEEGVMPLPKGIYYKVLASGKNDGKHPTPRSIVTAHYTGWTINGKKCVWATNGRCTFRRKWDTASSHSPASPAALP